MAIILKDLCRFCAKSHAFSKDLMEQDNNNVLKFVEEFVHIKVSEDEKLPTKICLDCEEKMLSFQMFLLECTRVQESLKKMIVIEDTENTESLIDVKLESLINSGMNIKSEVKDEFTVDDLVDSIDNDAPSETSFGADLSEEDIKESTRTQIKRERLKKKRLKRRPISEEDSAKFNEVLKQPNPQVKDFVRLSCHICEEDYNSWSKLRVHFAKAHKSNPVVYCICGAPITSKTVLYKHISDHKLESKQMKFKSGEDTETDDAGDSKYSSLNISDFVNFSCVHCDKKCSSWYKLKAHTERIHKTLPVVQCVCGFSVKSKSVLYKHISDHKNPDILSCDKCSKVTKSLSALEKHKLRHIPKADRVFKCNDCSKIFNTKEALKSHTKSHIPIDERKVFDCEFCDLKFTTRSSAVSHRRVVHEKIKSFVCDLCGYSCGTSGELKQHRAIHSDDKPYVCRTCGKPFKTYSNLKTHMDTHEDTSYACYVCNRILNSRRTLKKHLLVHEEKCRHICSYCNKAFKRRQTLKVHLYTHTGDKPLTCRWCEERFAYASTLRSHRLRCHPDKMTASQSANTYVYKNMFHDEIVKDEHVGFQKTDVDMTAR